MRVLRAVVGFVLYALMLVVAAVLLFGALGFLSIGDVERGLGQLAVSGMLVVGGVILLRRRRQRRMSAEPARQAASDGVDSQALPEGSDLRDRPQEIWALQLVGGLVLFLALSVGVNVARDHGLGWLSKGLVFVVVSAGLFTLIALIGVFAPRAVTRYFE